MIGYIFLTLFCTALLFLRKDTYLRKNKKGKYTLSIPREERLAENVIKNEQSLSQIVRHKRKKPMHEHKPEVRYKSLTPSQLERLNNIRNILNEK